MLSTMVSTNPLSAVELQQGLVANQFRLCYQPIVSLVTSRLLGWEALVRWQHPHRGQLGPSAFIPMAEKTGQISLLGEWILGQACQQLRDWQQKSGNLSLFINVNLSPLQLHHPRFLWQVDRTLAETGIEPRCLKLELTETAAINDKPDVLKLLKQLKRRGIQLFLDDFGTGYSSLMSVQSFPFDGLKIDRSFVSRLDAIASTSQIIIANILELARNLGMAAIAEGIETQLQLKHLQNLNCSAGQGYWFAPPLDATEIFN